MSAYPPRAANGTATGGPAVPRQAKTALTTVDESVIDAGTQGHDHYKHALPPWRYRLRQLALPLIRWETPYLALLQTTLRTPALDSYFAITANLGTHTFFMIGLPILFWCGYPGFGQGLVHILCFGVYWSGFVKDFFSLPRPLSPPLHRITMSGSVALEYGFPSTHSANAVSVVVYAVLCLQSPTNDFSPPVKTALQGLAYFYAVSIVFGRLYCGMHGFLDVIVGSIMGAIISFIEYYYQPVLAAYLAENGWGPVLTLLALILVFVRIHPEPADDCPCFDDTVAFCGVLLGLEPACWHYGKSAYSALPFDLSVLGWPAVVARVVFGVLCIFAWREVAKPFLLKGLPHLFRLLEKTRFSLPRRFFTPASEYKNIPARLKVDNVLPNVSDVSNFVQSIRHPGRGRSVSIGPQSAADAYETLAYRERRRRESIGSNGSLRSKKSIQELKKETDGGRSSGVPNSLNTYESMMGEGTVVASPVEGSEEPNLFVAEQDELSDKEVFLKLIKTRVRYDVEVITKLVVYAGIGYLAAEGIPVMFEIIPGLGAGRYYQ
ncbi:PAP2 superfamily protein [Microdochium trichocladiopsis]|uniref:PAP2 superfamily protein n=1 Tax=Microdochium trichocladiopsis TaxID=1682393 RepID=A0A9P8YGQ8_9PEZI|nr:PAP2 superfamily protein [Microdochium trichocladiopsis]KAH7039980.1 PAP2 superfamily protein [Microdochium trichocladiopsis]